MFYRLSGVTQRRQPAGETGSPQQGLCPGVPPARPPVVWAPPTKLASETGSHVDHLGADRVPSLQRRLQKSDRLPVHLKRGLMDKLVYRTTTGLTMGGVLCLVAVYIAAQPGNK